MFSDSESETVNLPVNGVHRWFVEIPKQTPALDILAHISVLSGKINVYSKLCKGGNFEKCFFTGWGMGSFIEHWTAHPFSQERKWVSSDAYIGYS